MNSQFLKRATSIALSGLMVTSLLAGCQKTTNPEPTKAPDTTEAPVATDAPKDPASFTGEISFAHFNNDEASAIVKAFNAKYPNVKVNLQVTADTNGAYQTLMTNALRTGTDVPDVYASEVAFVKRFVNIQNGYEDLSAAPYNAEELKNVLVPYTLDIGKSDDNKIRAVSHQACAGAVGYKREMAKKYLGTDEPEKIGEMFSSADKIVETAKILKEKSGGKAKIFPGLAELMRMYLGSRSQAWVVDNKLTIDPKMQEFVKLAKQLNDLGTLGSLTAWTPQWSAAIQDDVNFAYAIPTWGIPWIIDCNQAKDKQKTGDWGLAKAPTPYTWGGTWFGMYSGSKNKELAWEFIKFITCDEAQSKAWAKSSGDFVSNLKAIEELKADTSFVSQTVNQNPYEFFAPMLDGINGSIVTQYDDQITNPFQTAMESYLAGKTTEEQMWANWKKQLKNDLPDLTVE